jgi:hypothetical protein
MFHHEPRHSDVELEALRDYALPAWTETNAASDLVLAAEGMEVEVDGGEMQLGEFATSTA